MTINDNQNLSGFDARLLAGRDDNKLVRLLTDDQYIQKPTSASLTSNCQTLKLPPNFPPVALTELPADCSFIVHRVSSDLVGRNPVLLQDGASPLCALNYSLEFSVNFTFIRLH